MRLLERLNQPIQQNAVKTAIVPIYAAAVVLVEAAHDLPLWAAVTIGGRLTAYLGSLYPT